MAEYDDMAAPEEAMMEMRDEAKGADEVGEKIQIRKDFRATAVFLPNLKTGADGSVETKFKLPDSLTEYVVTVVAVKQNCFGKSEDSLVVANPLSVRDVETRILRPGDNGEAGVVLTNIGDSAEKVSVEFQVIPGLEKTGYVPQKDALVRLDGVASVSGTATKTVTVAPGKTETLMFRLDAREPGWITLAFRVKSASLNEVVYKPLQIEKPYIYETVTTVGQIDDGVDSAEEKIIFPSGSEDGRGSFTIQLDATRLGTLKSAVNYVFRYPYGCLEQRSSAVLPLIAFGDYMNVFGLKSEVTDAYAVAGAEIKTWASLQKTDGGFPYWPDGRESSFAVSLRIGEVLALAKEHGQDFTKTVNVGKLVSYIEAELKKEKNRWYPKAYSYYVLSRLGKKVSDSALRAVIEDKDAGISECAFAGLAALEQGNKAIVESAVQKLKNMMVLTTRGCSFQTETPFWSWYFCNEESERYALALHLFTLADKTDTYNSHLVWQLLERQKTGNGYWRSTATTSRVLIALDAYIRSMSLMETNLDAETLLGGKSLLKGHFEGAAAEPVERSYRFGAESAGNSLARDKHYNGTWELLGDLPLDKEVPLEVSRQGKGTLFYTASMSYALGADEQKARDEGLCVYVEITDARTGEKVKGNRLKSGTIYREKVYVTTTKARNFVAVRAPVPAGAELLNGAFVTTASVPVKSAEKEVNPWWWRTPMSHQDLYDAEVQCFWNTMPIGSYDFEFLFRAQRSGEYQTPCVLAECMYESEVFGRSDGKVWIIE